MQSYLYHKQIDLFLAVLVIAILAVLQIQAYLPAIKYSKTAHSTGACFQSARIDSLYYYAYHGEWPENNEQGLMFGWHDQYMHEDYAFEDILIKDGAINLHFNDFLDGKTITLRPAVPADDKFGPVIWVIGDNRPASEWLVFGDDLTDVGRNYISSYAR